MNYSRNPDSQGHYDHYGPSTPEAGTQLTAEDAAELDAVVMDGIARFERFYELAPGYYWQMIEVETVLRHSFCDIAGADKLHEMIERVRTRIYAQIESEMSND